MSLLNTSLRRMARGSLAATACTRAYAIACARAYALAFALACALASTAAQAHDYWIEPSSFRAQVGQEIALRVRVGENLVGEPVAYQARVVQKFFVEDAAGRRTIHAHDGAELAGQMKLVRPGTQVVGLWSGPFALELPPDKFASYLREEGLEFIEAQRLARGQSELPGREIFSRCAKSLVVAGPPTGSAASTGDRVLGLPIELVAERDPHTLAADQVLPVRLLWQGRPLANALVVALHATDPSVKQGARSDAEGRVRFRVDTPGTWLIKAVHMVSAPRGYDADWASWWASLTFER